MSMDKSNDFQVLNWLQETDQAFLTFTASGCTNYLYA